MGNKINIAEILKDKPQGTKLYSRICGAVEFERVFAVYQKKSIVVKELNSGNQHRFWHDGNFFRAGQCVLQPSENMADWSKFAWKKGDILVSNDGGTEVIFDKWYDETYTSFYCKHYLNSEDENKIVYHESFLCTTERYSLEDKDSVQTYINTIEERLGGKLNRETLEVEKAQPEFKDGDILSNPSTVLPKNHIFIFSKFDKHKDFEYHVSLTASGEITIPTSHGIWCRKDSGVKYATEEEKQQLFDALEKEGKAWDAEKKQIVNLKPKVELKPFDNVLVRHQKTEEWRANIFSHTDKTDEYLDYVCVNGRWEFCIPYEGNESLLGTTKDVEVSYGRSF